MCPCGGLGELPPSVAAVPIFPPVIVDFVNSVLKCMIWRRPLLGQSFGDLRSRGLVPAIVFCA